MQIAKSIFTLLICFSVAGFTLTPIATPPIESKGEALIAASSYIDNIDCQFGIRKIEVREEGMYFEISVTDVASADVKRCETVVILVCKVDGTLIENNAAAKCAV